MRRKRPCICFDPGRPLSVRFGNRAMRAALINYLATSTYRAPKSYEMKSWCGFACVCCGDSCECMCLCKEEQDVEIVDPVQDRPSTCTHHY